MEAKRNQYKYDTTNDYIEGNTVRKMNTVPDIQREERVYVPSPRKQEQRRPKGISNMNLASLAVLTIAIIATVCVCVEYLKLQYSVTSMESSIVTMENDLTKVTNENDASYAMINTTYDLDYIYKVAVEELGMVYPNNNKTITYQGSDDDYVRQYEDIPD